MSWKDTFIIVLVVVILVGLFAFWLRHLFYADYVTQHGRGRLFHYADVWDIQPADGGNYMKVQLMVAGDLSKELYVNTMEWERYGPAPYERVAVWEVGPGIALQPMKNKNILAARTRL